MNVNVERGASYIMIAMQPFMWNFYVCSSTYLFHTTLKLIYIDWKLNSDVFWFRFYVFSRDADSKYFDFKFEFESGDQK